jgi:hypothetical protein
VDEITLHPRDNAMLVATHGRALWILDHLEPIQEYTATQAAAADAKLFTVPSALEWKFLDDRNDEFWGHSYFMGENPPLDGVIQFHLKRPVSDLALRISDASGKNVRDVPVPASRNQAGIQTVCWDLRVAPIPADAPAAGGRGGRGGGGGGAPPVPGVPHPEPMAGYLPSNPCTDVVAGSGGSGGGGRGGGPNIGPYVMPGTYNVALIAGGQTLDTKPMTVIMDPAVRLTSEQRKRYDAIVTDLHDAVRLGTAAAGALNALYPQITAAASKLGASSAPAAVKAQFDAFKNEFDAVRVKFGVPIAAAAGRGGGGGGGGRGGANPENVLASTSALKVEISGIWESPSDATVRQSAAEKLALQKAVADANTFLAKATAMSESLKPYDIVLTVPTPIK